MMRFYYQNKLLKCLNCNATIISTFVVGPPYLDDNHCILINVIGGR